MIDETLRLVREHIAKHQGKVQAPFSIAGMQALVDEIDRLRGQRGPAVEAEPVDFQWKNIDGWLSASGGSIEDRRRYAKGMADHIGLGYRELYAAPPVEAVDWAYIKDDWEWTNAWEDRSLLVEDLPLGTSVQIGTLINGPDKWAAHVVTEFDEDGDVNASEVRWFKSKEDAEKALAEMASDPLRGSHEA